MARQGIHKASQTSRDDRDMVFEKLNHLKSFEWLSRARLLVRQ